MQVDYRYFPLSSLLNDIVDRIQPLCDQKRLKLELKFDTDLPQYVFSDQEKIDRVMTNILTNAVKYTPKGKIAFTAKYSRKNQQLFFSIKAIIKQSFFLLFQSGRLSSGPTSFCNPSISIFSISYSSSFLVRKSRVKTAMSGKQ